MTRKNSSSNNTLIVPRLLHLRDSALNYNRVKAIMGDLYNDPAQLSAVLTLLNANDSKTIKRGEKLLKPFTKTKNCVIPLLNQLQLSQDVSVRHHAALLLKSKLAKFFKGFNGPQQVQLRAQLLAIMLNEPIAVVSTSIAGCVAVVANEILHAKHQWPELFQALVQLAQNPAETMRVLNFRLLEQLSEHAADELKPHTATLAQMFQAGCQDPVSVVCNAALRSVSEFINNIGNEPEVLLLQGVIPPMLAGMGRCLTEGDEDVVVESLDFIQNCCGLEQPLIDTHIGSIVQFCMQTLQNDDIETSCRNAAFQTLLVAVECRPKLLAKQNLVNPILAALMEMIAKRDDTSAAGSLFAFHGDTTVETGGASEDDETVDVQKYAQTMIDQMAIYIPSKYFADPALALCAQGMTSADPNMRKAGCAVLGVMSEGCADRIRESLENILPALLSRVSDSEFYVREVACFALGQFSEFCQPEILSFHSSVLPVLLTALDDPKPTVQTTACYVIEYFCESLQPRTLRPVLPQLLAKLVGILHTGDKHAKQTALSAISSAAVASEKDFLPYVEGTVGMLNPLLMTTEPETFITRGRALECLGHIAVAVEADHFRQYFALGMQAAQQGIVLNDEGLKEYSYVFFANAAKVMKREMGPYLPTLIPHLHSIITESELTKTSNGADDDDDDEEYKPAGASAGGDDDSDDDDDGSDYDYNVHEGFINTKKAAITALGSIAENTLADFYPYMEACLKVILDPENGACTSIHQEIRSEGYSILQFFVSVTCHANGITEEPAKGSTLQLPQPVITVGHHVVEAYIAAINQDMEKEPVAKAMEGMTGVLRSIGMAALTLPIGEKNEQAITHLMTAILTILQEKAPCQLRVENKAEEDEDDDHDNLVMDGVTDLIGQLAKSMGIAFIPYFDEFYKLLLKFTKPSRLHSDRAMAIGCFAEVVKEIGPNAIKFADQLLPMIKKCLTDPMEGVRRNAAFCVGALAESTGDALAPQFMNILSWLHPLCMRPEHKKGQDVGGADIDNALAAVVRLINASPASVPLQHVLPILIANMPLVSDVSEGPGIYQCFGNLLVAKEANAVAHWTAILPIMTEVYATESTADDESRAIVGPFLKQLFVDETYRPAFIEHITAIADAEQKAQLALLLQ